MILCENLKEFRKSYAKDSTHALATQAEHNQS